MTDVNYTPEFEPADVDGNYGSTGGDITVPTFHDIKPFRFWCQKALPLVYDDSLSYYEVLCKVVNYLNNMMTDLTTGTGAITQFAQQFVINQQFLNDMAEKLGKNTEELEDYINDRMGDFTNAYNELQGYVNQYFNNLDVQDEIDAKLDDMVESGQFNVLFDPVIQAWMEEETEFLENSVTAQNAVLAQQNGRISTLESRMDTFASLPSGSTSGNAELLDIRTNFLGETYPSAGDAVRASDMIASGFQSISATKLENWDGNKESSVYDSIQIDIGGYKGGHVAVIGSFEYFQSDLDNTGACAVCSTNTPGEVEDANAVNYLPGTTNSIFTNFTQITTNISGEERLLLQFAIPDNFSYQYLKIGHFEHNPLSGYYTEPLYIVYANSWSKTQVDPTLSVTGEAADAKATGDALSELNERIGNEVNNLDNVVKGTQIIKSSPSYILGGYNLSTGEYMPPSNPSQSPVSVDSDFTAFQLLDNVVTVTVKADFRARFILLNPDKTFNGYIDWVTGTSQPANMQNKKGYFVKSILGKSSGANITLTEVATYGNDNIQIITDIRSLSARLYADNVQYELGAIRIHDGELIRNINPASASETYSANKWIQTFNGDEIFANEKNITSLEQGVEDILIGNTVKQSSSSYILGVYNLTTGVYSPPSNPAQSTGCVDSRLREFELLSDKIYVEVEQGFVARFIILNPDKTFNSYINDSATGYLDGLQNKKGYFVKPILRKSGGATITKAEAETYGKGKINIIADVSPYKLHGKTVVNFGDSIFGNKRPPYDISTKLSELTGATVYNLGFGGTRISKPSNANWAAFSMYELAKSISTNDFTTQDNVDITTAGLPDYFADTLDLLESIDFSKVDIVTLAYGTNDYSGDAALEISNLYSSGTYGGAIRYVLETLWSAYPNLEIVLCTPTYRFWMDSQGDFVDDSDTRRNGQNLLLTDYVAKMQTLSNDYHVTCIDNYYKLGINKFNRSNWFPVNDGTHHNYAGACLIAEHIANELF